MRFAIIVAITLAAGPAHAHGGGLDANGCHHDRKNGGYHCHRTPAPAVRAPPTSQGGQARPQGLTSGGVFRNCTEARAAGAAPVMRGDPGFGQHLDRDNDGIGCE